MSEKQVEMTESESKTVPGVDGGVKDALGRHRDFVDGEAVIRFVTDADELPLDDSELTPESRGIGGEEHDFVVGLELSSGFVSLYGFERPNPDEWDGSEVKAFLDSVGVAPANLEDAVGTTIEITFDDGEAVPKVLTDGEENAQSLAGPLFTIGASLFFLAITAAGAAAFPVTAITVVWAVFFAYLIYSINASTTGGDT